MIHGHPTLQRICPLSPWVEQQCPQLMAPRLPMGPCTARAVGFGAAIVPFLFFCIKKKRIKKEMVGVLVFGGNCLMMANNNQLRVGVGNRLEVQEEVRGAGGKGEV